MRYFFIFGMMFGLSGCMNCDSLQSFNAADSGREIRMHQGDKLLIKLDVNPSTGYTWRFFVTPKNGVIKALEEKYLATKPELCGSGGQMEYSFMANQAGISKIEAFYYRPWEKLDRAKAQKVEYQIIVE